ncbi:MAG: aminotransferase class I/II-fold pyridoxal phosphate-dependent enzyme, partial [Chloroflexota bacterium]
MKIAERISKVPPYQFAEIDRKKQQALARGVDVINLGVGDPDRPTPADIVARACSAVRDPDNHRYPAYEGSAEFRRAVADWYQQRYGVGLDPDSEVMALIGSKEGIAHVIWALVDPGDFALLPDPYFPMYLNQTLLAGGQASFLPLRAEHGFLPDFSSVDRTVLDRATMMLLNYPNNPTGAVADLGFFTEAVAFAREHDLVFVHDSAYAEVTFDGYAAPSPLQVPGAKEMTVDIGSFSKTFNMTGWRIGYIVGSAEALKALGVIKMQTDSGAFTAIQEAAIEGLRRDWPGFPQEMNAIYARRRDILVDGLTALGWRVSRPRGTFYVWARTPAGMSSAEAAT